MRFGVHVGIGKGFAKSVAEALAAGCDCIQIFAGNPRAFRIAAFDPKEWEAFRRLRTERGIQPTVIHTSYLINLATAQKDLHDKSVALVANDLRIAAQAGIEYVNTHLGSYGNQSRDVGFQRICKTIERLIGDAPPGPMLLLENSAGAGSLCGGTLDELGAILKAVGSKRVGVCLDTAHAWASGYNLATAEGLDGFLRDIRKHIGFRRVRALHMNDTQVELGARRDLHWHVGKGKIGTAGFKRLLTVAELAHVACICETPKSPADDAKNVAMVRRLAGRPARPVPVIRRAGTAPNLRKKAEPLRGAGGSNGRSSERQKAKR
jgi:deoxyribonuclease-4